MKPNGDLASEERNASSVCLYRRTKFVSLTASLGNPELLIEEVTSPQEEAAKKFDFGLWNKLWLGGGLKS